MTTEKDPNGLDPHAPGAKLDDGKEMVDLVLGDFAHALMEVCKVGSFGARKYSESGWLDVDNGIRRYADAKGRHYLKQFTEGPIDEDSGCLHLAQELWNGLAQLELMLRKEQAAAIGTPLFHADNFKALKADLRADKVKIT